MYVNTELAELGTAVVWRELHPFKRDFTSYSAPHSVHTRPDYFFRNTSHRFRTEEYKTGVADLSRSKQK